MVWDVLSVITPDRQTGDVIVRGNEILVGERRQVFRLAGAERTGGAPLMALAYAHMAALRRLEVRSAI